MVLPTLPYPIFCKLAGPELSAEAAEVLKRPGIVAVVLCGDAKGERCALVAVGEGQTYATLKDVSMEEIDGLTACCATRLAERSASEESARAGNPRSPREEALAERERLLAEKEKRIAELEARVNQAVRALSQR